MGSASYSIPLMVPPGTAGMAPSLSLNYSSQGGNGIAGMGWSLGGLDAITRCPQTIAQDGFRGGINYDGNDRFCLDGQRLINISGAYGADGTIYATEIEGFYTITSHGTLGTGPAWFTVQTKSGQTMEFGHTTDSQILAMGGTTARMWALNKVIDTVNNYLTITYNNQGYTSGYFLPQEIDYAGNGTSYTPYNAIYFTYTLVSRVTSSAITPPILYQAGAAITNPYVLTDIKSYSYSALVNDYRLTYAADAVTSRLNLASVTACDSGACVPPTSFTTSFTYTSGSGPSDLLSTITSGLGATTTISYLPLTNGSIYAKGTGAAYPQIDLQAPMSVVSRQDSSNGVGGNYSSIYSYNGLRADLSGRGVLGFAQMQANDLQTGIQQVTSYNQPYPLTGTVASQAKTLGTVTLNQTTTSYSTIPLGGTRELIETLQTIENSTDYDSLTSTTTPLPSVTTTFQTYDSYANPTQIEVQTSDGYTKVTNNTYTNSGICLSRLMTASVQSFVPAQAPFLPSGEVVTRSSSFDYDPTTCLLKQEVVEPGGTTLRLQTDYTRDTFGNIHTATVSATGIATRVTTTTYDSAGRFPVSVQNPALQTTYVQYDYRFGGMTSQTDPNGLITTWIYDTFGRKATENRPDGTQSIWTYYTTPGCTGTCSVTQTSTGQPTKVEYYDVLERPHYDTVAAFDGTNLVVQHLRVYDANGRIANIYQPYLSPASAPLYNTINVYDPLGRLTTETAPDGGVSTFNYNGLSTSITDALGHKTTTVKDSQSQVVSVTDPLGGPAHTATYAYHPFGLVAGMIDPAGNQATMTYNIRGNKTQDQTPDRGTWNYTFDALGQMNSQTDADGNVTNISYDVLGRVFTRDDGVVRHFSYDTQPHGIGKLAQAWIGSSYVRTESYDSLSRPSQTVLTLDTTTETASTTYDPTYARVTSKTYPSGLVVGYSYTSLGYLSSVTNGVGGPALWTADARDAYLNLTQETYGNGIVNTQQFYPDTGRIDTVQTGSGGAVLNLVYSWDLVGNLSSRVDNNAVVTENFTYDPLNRVSGVSGGTPTKTFNYDAIGNITSKSDVGGTYVYTAPGTLQPHAVQSIPGGTVNNGTGLVSDPAYTYDLNGNLTILKDGFGATVTTLTYTAANRTATITKASGAVISYGYDTDDQRYKQQVVSGGTTTTTYYWNAGGVMSEETISSAGAIGFANYIVAGGETVGIMSSGATTANTWGGTSPWGTLVWNTGSASVMQYFHGDHLGSIVAITATSGTRTHWNAYDVWGKQRFTYGADDPGDTLSSGANRAYTDQEQVADVAWVNLNARMYDAQIGKFLSADPMVSQPFSTQGWNRYSYAGNNPLAYTDPSGMCFLGCFWKRSIFRDVLAIAVAFVGQEYLLPEVFGISGAEAAVISGAAAGGIQSGSLRGALTGGIEAGLFYGVGSATDAHFGSGGVNAAGEGLNDAGHTLGQYATMQTGQFLENVAGHAVIGGLGNIANVSSFQSGFVSAGFSDFAGPVLANLNADGLVEESVAGGIGSVLGGGKFGNGAVTGAFGYLFNDLTHLGLPQSGQGLTFNTTSGGPGFASWGGNWQLSQPSQNGGYVVQQVTGYLYVFDSTTGTVQTDSSYQYWEAWPVSPGATTATGTDTFTASIVGGGGYGFDSVNTNARFYEGLTLPSTFGVGNVPYAGSAPSTYFNPNLPLGGATSPVTRSFYTEF